MKPSRVFVTTVACQCAKKGEAEAFALRYGLSLRAALFFECTTEHLLALCEGGRDTGENIVAACWHCNTTRHRRKEPASAERYRTRVQMQVRAGKWQTVRLLSGRRYAGEGAAAPLTLGVSRRLGPAAGPTSSYPATRLLDEPGPDHPAQALLDTSPLSQSLFDSVRES